MARKKAKVASVLDRITTYSEFVRRLFPATQALRSGKVQFYRQLTCYSVFILTFYYILQIMWPEPRRWMSGEKFAGAPTTADDARKAAILLSIDLLFSISTDALLYSYAWTKSCGPNRAPCRTHGKGPDDAGPSPQSGSDYCHELRYCRTSSAEYGLAFGSKPFQPDLS